MNWPRVSVIVTTYNRFELVQRALKSVLMQGYANFDVHVVDDASEDETRHVLEPIAAGNDRIFYWRHEKRSGLSAARNTKSRPGSEGMCEREADCASGVILSDKRSVVNVEENGGSNQVWGSTLESRLPPRD